MAIVFSPELHRAIDCSVHRHCFFVTFIDGQCFAMKKSKQDQKQKPTKKTQESKQQTQEHPGLLESLRSN